MRASRMLLLSSGGGFLPEANRLFAAMTSPPDSARRKLYNDLIKALKDGGVWDKLDALYIIAAHDAQAARLNVRNPGTFDLTVSGSPTFTTDRGYAGDGSAAYLNTGFNPTTASTPKYAQNSAHLSGWNRTARAAANVTLIGGRQSTTVWADLAPRIPGDFALLKINASANGTPANNNSSGHFIANRSGASAQEMYRNGSSIGTSTNASATPPNVSLTLLARNVSSSTPDAFSSDQVAQASIGSSLTSGESSAYYTAVAAWMTAVGA